MWQHLLNLKTWKPSSPARVDFVLDNSGFELYTDLCLAEFLLTEKFCGKVNFHVKSMPWFVSDVTSEDFAWTLRECCLASGGAVQELGKRWTARMSDGTFNIVNHNFWTLPYDFAACETVSPELYTQLGESQLVIFKGDLNYRKLVGDREWPCSTPFSTALHGFCPAPLCTLRTLKADVCVGLKEGQDTELSKGEEKWMVSGNNAVIQFCDSL